MTSETHNTALGRRLACWHGSTLTFFKLNLLSLANIIGILALSKKISSLNKLLWRIKTRIGEGGYLHQFPR